MGFLSDRASQAMRFDDLDGRFDPWLLTVTITLAAFGVVMVASSSMPYAVSNGSGPFYYLTRHVVFLGGGVLLAAMLMRTEMKRVEQYSQYFLPLCIMLLVAVWMPGVGRRINGAQR